MKKNLNTVSLVLCLLLSSQIKSQRISIDIAGVRNHTQQLHGANFSVFYHFTKMLSAGVEVNRFFPKQTIKENKIIFLSAWDYDINVHYYIPLGKKIYVYPLAGVSYAQEREEKETGTSRHHIKYFNTGAGILLNTRFIKPHIEYVIASSRKTEQFTLAGITIELDLKK